MAITRINVGTVANDGTGNNLREAFVIVNNNFDYISANIENPVTAENLGDGQGIFYSKENGVLGLKSLKAGTNISLTSDNDSITITNTESISLIADAGGGAISGANKSLGFTGGLNINTSAIGNTVTFAIDPVNLLSQDTNPTLGGHLNASMYDVINVGTIVANTFSGPLEGTVDGINVTDFYNKSSNVFSLDFGQAVPNVTSGLDYLISQANFDYGSFTAPATIESDFGSIV